MAAAIPAILGVGTALFQAREARKQRKEETERAERARAEQQATVQKQERREQRILEQEDARRRRALLALQAGTGGAPRPTLLTGPGGLGAATGGRRRTLLGV